MRVFLGGLLAMVAGIVLFGLGAEDLVASLAGVLIVLGFLAMAAAPFVALARRRR